MKKITALMLSSAMMLSLAACGGSASTETVSSEAASSEAASSEAVSTEEAASADAAALTTVNAGKLTMSTNAAFPPYEMTTDTGDFEGIDIEVAGAIAKKLGLERRSTTWTLTPPCWQPRTARATWSWPVSPSPTNA